MSLSMTLAFISITIMITELDTMKQWLKNIYLGWEFICYTAKIYSKEIELHNCWLSLNISVLSERSQACKTGDDKEFRVMRVEKPGNTWKACLFCCLILGDG